MTDERSTVAIVLERGRILLDPLVRRFGYGLGTVFFIPNPWLGLIFWAGLFSAPRLGLFALLGLGVGTLLKKLLNLNDVFSLGGGIKANALLTAVATGWLLWAQSLPLWAELSVAAVAAAIAGLVTAAIMFAMSGTRFPVMVAGYCLVASLLFVLCPACTVAAAGLMEPWVLPAGLNGWLEAFVRSLGSLVYSPSIPFGLLVCVAFLLWSRAAFLAGLLAWVSGVGACLLLHRLGFEFLYLAQSYNFFMSGVALGAVLFLPGRASLLLAILAGAFCAVLALALQVIFAAGAIAYLPISSMLTVWVGIGAISLAGPSAIARRYSASRFPPEIAWLNDAYLARRFGAADPLLAVPLAGDLLVAQGFSGDVTHSGKWQHALDFQAAEANGQVGQLWGALVLSPGSGMVEAIKNSVADNPLGGSDFRDNWGNYVVIRLDQGGWVLLGHLMQGSIGVTVGMRVETGSVLGKVGNSGRSPVPHLHLQLQSAPEVGSPTRPFKLANFLLAGTAEAPWLQWQAAGVPEQGACLRAALPNPAGYEILTQMMPGSAVWFCETSGELPVRLRRANAQRTTRVQVTLDEAGRYRFDAGPGGRLVASLEPDAWRIMALERVQSSLLALLASTVPVIPYAIRPGMRWADVPPVALHGMGFAESLAPFLGRSFALGHYVCQAMPQAGKALLIEARFASDDEQDAVSARCRIEHLRGPVALEVEFRTGRIVFSQLSFEPGLPPGAAS